MSQILPAFLLLLLTLTSPWGGVRTARAAQGSACPPGVQCEHGHCSGDTGQCVCEEGWAGWHCQTPCPDLCQGQGQCQTGSDGSPYCQCPAGMDYVTDRGCVTTGTAMSAFLQADNGSLTTTTTSTTTVTTTTTEPLTTAINTTTTSTTPSTTDPVSARTCVPGFVCQHGRCASDSIRCDCEDGWSGIFCTERCAKNCTAHGTCMIHVDGTSYCSCDWLYIGEFCEEEREVSTQTAWSPSTHSSSSHPANHSQRPMEERTCAPGFVCEHGHCAPGPLPECVCEEGWRGVLCHVCGLDCGQHGTCQVVTSSPNTTITTTPNTTTTATTTTTTTTTTVCRCRDGFSGPRCLTGPNDKSTRDGNGTLSTSPDWNMPNLRPLAERQCVPGFVCLHGRCAGSGIECQCDPEYVGTFCHQRCPVQCEHGQCVLDSEGVAYCSCQPLYTGHNCSQLRQLPEMAVEDKTIQWYIVGACTGLLVVVLVLLAVLPYCMWKRGHLLLMKIVYHFKAFEDDDDKQYDAFISYSSVDEDFVVHHLFPKLTAMNFSVCVHRKDFIPGETIANNIIEAVENSRRTILVLTPHFIQSQFCRFEYQQAQYQMIQHKHRIVPIVLQDVSQEKKNMDASLKSILSTITYLDWPPDSDPKQVDKFWKRLELSMPKRKSQAESPPRSDSSLYSRLDSTSSGYSTASSTCGSKSMPPSLLDYCNAQQKASPSAHKSAHNAAHKSAHNAAHKSTTSSGHKVKKSRSMSGQSTSSRDSRLSQPPPGDSRRSKSRSKSASRSQSKSRAARAESVTIEMEGCRGKINGINGCRQGSTKPTYILS